MSRPSAGPLPWPKRIPGKTSDKNHYANYGNLYVYLPQSTPYTQGGSCQTPAMVYSRAYLARVVCYSGGAITMGAPPDPTNHPALLGAHGAVGSDVFGNPIATNTILLEDDLKSKGSFVIDCDDGGD